MSKCFVIFCHIAQISLYGDLFSKFPEPSTVPGTLVGGCIVSVLQRNKTKRMCVCIFNSINQSSIYLLIYWNRLIKCGVSQVQNLPGRPGGDPGESWCRTLKSKGSLEAGSLLPRAPQSSSLKAYSWLDEAPPTLWRVMWFSQSLLI